MFFFTYNGPFVKFWRYYKLIKISSNGFCVFYTTFKYLNKYESLKTIESVFQKQISQKSKNPLRIKFSFHISNLQFFLENTEAEFIKKLSDLSNSLQIQSIK